MHGEELWFATDGDLQLYFALLRLTFANSTTLRAKRKSKAFTTPNAVAGTPKRR